MEYPDGSMCMQRLPVIGSSYADLRVLTALDSDILFLDQNGEIVYDEMMELPIVKTTARPRVST